MEAFQSDDYRKLLAQFEGVMSQLNASSGASSFDYISSKEVLVPDLQSFRTSIFRYANHLRIEKRKSSYAECALFGLVAKIKDVSSQRDVLQTVLLALEPETYCESEITELKTVGTLLLEFPNSFIASGFTRRFVYQLCVATDKRLDLRSALFEEGSCVLNESDLVKGYPKASCAYQHEDLRLNLSEYIEDDFPDFDRDNFMNTGTLTFFLGKLNKTSVAFLKKVLGGGRQKVAVDEADLSEAKKISENAPDSDGKEPSPNLWDMNDDSDSVVEMFRKLQRNRDPMSPVVKMTKFILSKDKVEVVSYSPKHPSAVIAAEIDTTRSDAADFITPFLPGGSAEG